MGVSTESKQRAWDGNGGWILCVERMRGRGRERERSGGALVASTHKDTNKGGKHGVFSIKYTRGE